MQKTEVQTAAKTSVYVFIGLAVGIIVAAVAGLFYVFLAN